MSNSKLLVKVTDALGESISEATVGEIFKKVGDTVKIDDPILSLETDKASMDVTAPSDGVITQIMVKPEETVNIGSDLAEISPAGSVPTKEAAAPAPQPDNTAQQNNASKISPAVQKLADEKNVNPQDVTPTGKFNRVTKTDINATGSNAAQSFQSNNSSTSSREVISTPLTNLRKTIAKRLKSSQENTATLTTFNEVDLHAVMSIRKEQGVEFKDTYGCKLGIMSFFIKAASQALFEIPKINSTIQGNMINTPQYHDIGVAVSTPKGLVVPVIRDVQSKNFHNVEGNLIELAKKARDFSLSMKEMQNATFTITNGGTFGSLLSTPIINPPQSAILGMHTIQQRPVAINGEIVIRPMMYLALSYDHCLIDGEEAITFLGTIKKYIENPARFFLYN